MKFLSRFHELYNTLQVTFPQNEIELKGLCKAISLHLHRAEKSKNNPLKLMVHTCC